MQYLTPSEMKKVAPAISRLPPSEENLIDTTLFVRHLDTLGYRPMVAIQGTPHADAQSQTKGRHLVVCANRTGECIAILNSHTVWRRAWLGAGYLVGNTEKGGPEFVIGAVVPLPRWRGFPAPLSTLMGYMPSMLDAKRDLDRWNPTEYQIRWMARYFAINAYLPGHKTPVPKDIIDVSEWTDSRATPVLAHLLRGARFGGAKPFAHPLAHMKPRKLKPVQAPDAVFKAANAAFQTGIAAMAKYRVGTYAFPQFSSRDTYPQT